MVLTKEAKAEIIKDYQIHDGDCGSTEVQAAMITKRIDYLSKHLESHTKDHNSRRGLIKLVGKRKRLLNYLRKNDIKRYKQLIEKLGLRK